MLTADFRCSRCQEQGRGIYRMVGHCLNCKTEDVLMLFSETHEALGGMTCPKCGTSNLRAQRLATDDEIPVG